MRAAAVLRSACRLREVGSAARIFLISPSSTPRRGETRRHDPRCLDDIAPDDCIRAIRPLHRHRLRLPMVAGAPRRRSPPVDTEGSEDLVSSPRDDGADGPLMTLTDRRNLRRRSRLPLVRAPEVTYVSRMQQSKTALVNTTSLPAYRRCSTKATPSASDRTFRMLKRMTCRLCSD